MLTLAATTDEFLFVDRTTAAAVDDLASLQHAEQAELIEDRNTYFDVVMRVRLRRPAQSRNYRRAVVISAH